MITIQPVQRALVPVDSAAAEEVSAPNYDEFQGDLEVWNFIQAKPSSVLKITMAHADVDQSSAMLKDGSSEALERSAANMQALLKDPKVREVNNLMWIYEIVSHRDPNLRQTGLGGMARTDEIRTDETPNGSVIRNEGVREYKAKGRADLIKSTKSFIGMVNNAIEDASGKVQSAFESYADGHDHDIEVTDEHGNRHRLWLLTDVAVMKNFQDLLAAEPCAFVADGNHRSAAAAMLKCGNYLSVFFPAATMGIFPYNRLVSPASSLGDTFIQSLDASFEVNRMGEENFQPTSSHEVGCYFRGSWYKLTPRANTFDPANAVEDIDADIVQRKLFDALLNISDPADHQLTYVGANKDAAYLRQKVDEGEHAFALTLPPVTMEQFINVCKQNRFMPPKSTWFEPKVRSGLVIALLDNL